MKREIKNNFSKGMIDGIDAELIPEGALQRVENMEQDVAGVYKIRKGRELHEYDTHLKVDYAKLYQIYIWYPNASIAGATSLSEIIVVLGNLTATSTDEARAYYRGASSFEYTVLPQLTADMSPTTKFRFSGGNSQLVAVSDDVTTNVIYVNGRGQIKNSALGLYAPQLFGEFDNDSNIYRSVDGDAIGMGIDRGSIPTYAFTQVTKDGVESNPSPLFTNMDANERKLDDNLVNEEYWISTVIRKIRSVIVGTTGYENLEDFISGFNIYRTSSICTEPLGDQAPLQFVKTIDVVDVTASNSATDADIVDSTKQISYANQVASSATDVAHAGDKTFLFEADDDIKFPYVPEYYMEIRGNNINSTSFIQQPFGVAISDDDLVDDDGNPITGLDWETMIGGDKNNPDFTGSSGGKSIRFFAEDMTTPLPALGHYISGTTDSTVFHMKVPNIHLNTNTVYMLIGGNPSNTEQSAEK